MIIENIHGIKPNIASDAFVAPNATIIGDVTIKSGANIWYGAVLRGDECSITIGENTSIQDNCVVHSEPGTSFSIGKNCIVGHLAMLHGPGIIGDECLIGIQSTILQGTNIGEGSIVAAGSMVTRDVPENVMVMGAPAKVKKELDEKAREMIRAGALAYAKKGKELVKNQL